MTTAAKSKAEIPPGTPFQQAVWTELTKIPRGQTITYTELAARVGRPRAVRAAAGACGKNPLIEVIPCHRVIATDGSLGGYSGKGGVARKRELLIAEGALKE